MAVPSFGMRELVDEVGNRRRVLSFGFHPLAIR
jgi:hypothetical protein